MSKIRVIILILLVKKIFSVIEHQTGNSSLYFWGLNRFYAFGDPENGLLQISPKKFYHHEMFSQSHTNQIIPIDDNTIYLIDHSKIYVTGRGDNAFFETSTNIPTLIYSNERMISRIHGSYYNGFVHLNDGTLLSWGENEFCQSGIDIIGSGTCTEIGFVPIVIHYNVGVFSQMQFYSILQKRGESTIYSCGRNTNYILGAEINGGGYTREGFASVVMDNINEPASSIRFITTGTAGVFVVYKSNNVVAWGKDVLSMVYVVTSPYIYEPEYVDFSSYINNGIIVDIAYYSKACFLLVSNGGTNKVYSYGYDNAQPYLSRPVLGNDWLYPKEIDDGGIEASGDEIKMITVLNWVSFFYTKKGYIYGIGRNNENLLDSNDTTLLYTTLTRIFTDITIHTDTLNVLYVPRNCWFHCGFVISTLSVSLDYTDEIIFNLILYTSISLLLIVIFIIVVIIITAIVIILIKPFKQYEKDVQNILLEERMVSKQKRERETSKYIEKELSISKKEMELFKKKFCEQDDSFEEFKTKLFKNHSLLHDIFKIDYKDIKLQLFLGSGGSGASIFSCTWKGKACAFKSFPMKFDVVEENFGEFQKEISIFLQTDHVNILKLYGFVLSSKNVGLVMEYCRHGDVRSFLKLNPTFPIEERIRVGYEIACGIKHLHSIGVCHRDIKLQNVLLALKNDSLQAKVMDFGLSKSMSNTLSVKTVGVGTEKYMAPEMIVGDGKYTKAVDVFSYAISLYMLITNDFNPFKDSKYGENVLVKIATDPKCRPTTKNIQQKWIVDLLTNCWNHDPFKRPNFMQICNSFNENTNLIEDNEVKYEVKKECLVYFKTKEMTLEEAEDFEIEARTFDHLLKSISKWKTAENKLIESIFLLEEGKKTQITTDKDVYHLTHNAIMEVNFKQN